MKKKKFKITGAIANDDVENLNFAISMYIHIKHKMINFIK